MELSPERRLCGECRKTFKLNKRKSEREREETKLQSHSAPIVVVASKQ